MPRILFVDVNAENRDWLSRRLERRGFEVLLAIDGKAGVATALAEKPDLILMDMNMPQVDGWEATRQIKAATAAVPIIALTAHALAGDRERALQSGCTAYHTKPIDFPELLSQIELLLDASREREASPPPR